MWELPINIFNKFSQVFILTYLFKGSYQKSYFDLYDIEYKYMCMQNKSLVPYQETSKEEREEIKALINIIDNERLNQIGKEDYSLSSSWYKRNVRKSGKETVFSKGLRNHLENYFNKICKGKTKNNLWSTFKDYKNRVKGKGYTKGFLEYNTRATNEYREKSNLAYMLNLYPHTSMTLYFRDKNIEIDRDSYALSIMLQWIWRSRIRNYDDALEDRKINLYLPSLRMRNLLQKWLGKK